MILDYFPRGMLPRPEQKFILESIEAGWRDSDVFVVEAPTAVGKSAVAVTIASWAESLGKNTTISVPSNMLLDQYRNSFPDLPILYRQDNYECADFARSCGDTKAAVGRHCGDCPYLAVRAGVKQSAIRACVYQNIGANKLYSQVMVYDEAHNLVETLRDLQQVRLWQRQAGFPDGMVTVADVIEWAQTQRTPKYDAIVSQLAKLKRGGVVEYLNGSCRGKPDVCLHITATSATGINTWLRPGNHAEKVILMSATTGEQDVQELGLSRYRVKYIKCNSPIPIANRPIKYLPAANMAHKFRSAAVPLLAKALNDIIVTNAAKGLIHVPYAVAAQLRAFIGHPRIIWHTKSDKAQQFAEFLASSDGVLVASGMYEGIDLPYDAARWQVIGVVPFPPLNVEWIKSRAENDPDWYAWETIKKLVQTAGRVVRAVDDFGVTYVMDTQFKRIWDDDRRRPSHLRLFPNYIAEAVTF